MRKHRPEIIWTWLKEIAIEKKMGEFPPKPFGGKWPTRLFLGEVKDAKLKRGLIVKPDAPGREFLRKMAAKWQKGLNQLWVAEFDRAGVLTYTYATPRRNPLGNLVIHARRAIQVYYPYAPPVTLLSAWKLEHTHERLCIAGRFLSIYSTMGVISKAEALALEKIALKFYPELKK